MTLAVVDRIKRRVVVKSVTAAQMAALAARVRELEDPAEFAVASRASVAQAARFSWDESARRLLDLTAALGAARRAARARTGRSSR